MRVGLLVVNGDLDLSDVDKGVIDGTIAVPAKVLTVNVAFPNNIVDNEVDYQDMEVTISGGDLKGALTYELSDNSATEVTALTDNKTLNFWNN